MIGLLGIFTKDDDGNIASTSTSKSKLSASQYQATLKGTPEQAATVLETFDVSSEYKNQSKLNLIYNNMSALDKFF